MKKYKLFIAIVLLVLISNTFYAQRDTTPRAPFKKLSFARDPRSFDVSLFRSANRYRTGIRDFVIPIIDKTMLPATIGIPFAIYWYGRAAEKPYDEQTGFIMATSLLANAGLTFAMKTIINRKRPYVALSNVYYEGEAGFDVYSFPSGHTSSVMSLSTIMALRYPEHPQYYLPFFAWGFTVAYGRMYMGVHYPIDLIGGSIVGITSALVTYALRSEILTFKNYLFNENKSDGYNKNIDFAMVAFSLLGSTFINEFLTPRIGEKDIHVSPDLNQNGLQMKMSMPF